MTTYFAKTKNGAKKKAKERRNKGFKCSWYKKKDGNYGISVTKKN